MSASDIVSKVEEVLDRVHAPASARSAVIRKIAMLLRGADIRRAGVSSAVDDVVVYVVMLTRTDYCRSGDYFRLRNTDFAMARELDALA